VKTKLTSKSGNVMGKKHFHKNDVVFGWFKDVQKQWYNKKVKSIHDGVIVEIGVFGGVSILSIVDMCIKNNNVIYGIDPWNKLTSFNGEKKDDDETKLLQDRLEEVYKHLKNIITKYGYEENIKLIKGFSYDKWVLDQFSDESIDLLFIDGEHTYDSVARDLELWHPKVKPNGAIAGHDWKWNGIQLAVKDYCEKRNYKVKAKNDIWKIIRNIS